MFLALKTGDKHKIENYRPIVSIYISRIFWITFNLDFAAGRATNDEMISLLEFVYKNLNENKLVASIFFDLSKAFDIVHHNLLVNKLECNGISEVDH